jgi:hypothetical protein
MKHRIVFPVRHHESFNRRNSWVLVFSSPAQAKRYQDRACSLRSLAAKYALSPSVTKTGPSFSLTAALRYKPYDYTLASPFQSLSLVAKLSPFGHKLTHTINTHDTLLGTQQTGKKAFPVRLWVDCPGRQILTFELIKKLLELDGVARGSAWQLSRNPSAIVPANDPARMSQENLDTHGVQSSRHVAGNWQVDFNYASEANRFVRLWHKKRLPQLENHSRSNSRVVANAECLF